MLGQAHLQVGRRPPKVRDELEFSPTALNILANIKFSTPQRPPGLIGQLIIVTLCLLNNNTSPSYWGLGSPKKEPAGSAPTSTKMSRSAKDPRVRTRQGMVCTSIHVDIVSHPEPSNDKKGIITSSLKRVFFDVDA